MRVSATPRVNALSGISFCAAPRATACFDARIFKAADTYDRTNKAEWPFGDLPTSEEFIKALEGAQDGGE